MIASYKPNKGQIKLRNVLRKDGKTKVLCYSGSRAGKTFELIRAIVSRAVQSPRSRHVIIRKHFSLVKKFIWMDTLPEVMRLCFPELAGCYEVNKTDYFYRFFNGSEVWLGGLDDKERADRILGSEYNTLYFNECSEISWHSVSTALTRLARRAEKEYKGTDGELIKGALLTNKAFFDCNPPAKGHWSYKLFVNHIDPETRIKVKQPQSYAAVHISTKDNAENLGKDFINELQGLTGSKRKRFYEGLYQDDVHGALWTEEMINQARGDAPDLMRVVVAIDPATTVTATSDETGIIVAGKCGKGHYYILDDLSGFYSPNEWGAKARAAYKKYKADRIIAETNQGGDMVKAIIHNLDPNLAFEKVTATRGKLTRAEPVAALYEQKKVHHVKEFPDMEFELTNYTGQSGEVSPNRLDSLVWGVTGLMDAKERSTGLPINELTKMFY